MGFWRNWCRWFKVAVLYYVLHWLEVDVGWGDWRRGGGGEGDEEGGRVRRGVLGGS